MLTKATDPTTTPAATRSGLLDVPGRRTPARRRPAAAAPATAIAISPIASSARANDQRGKPDDGEPAQHAPLAVRRDVHRQHDQAGGADDDGEVGRDVPVRRVHRERVVGLGAERPADDQHGHDREHEDEGQRERVAGEQPELGGEQPAGRRPWRRRSGGWVARGAVTVVVMMRLLSGSGRAGRAGRAGVSSAASRSGTSTRRSGGIGRRGRPARRRRGRSPRGRRGRRPGRRSCVDAR